MEETPQTITYGGVSVELRTCPASPAAASGNTSAMSLESPQTDKEDDNEEGRHASNASNAPMMVSLSALRADSLYCLVCDLDCGGNGTHPHLLSVRLRV